MILFKPEHVDPILRGEKIQTRRTGKCRWRPGSIHECRTEMFGKPFAKVRILSVRQEPLGAITEDDAMREGYGSVEEYLEAFFRIYEKKLKGMRLVDIGRMPVWVIDFEVVGP